MKFPARLITILTYLVVFPQVAGSQSLQSPETRDIYHRIISPEIKTFCTRVFSRAANLDGNKNLTAASLGYPSKYWVPKYVNGCNAFLYPEKYTPEGPIVVKAPPAKVEPDKGNTCAVFGDGNVICSLAPSHPLRPRQYIPQEYGGVITDKNTILLDMFWWMDKHQVEKMQIAAQLQELEYSKHPNYGPVGKSKCWVISGHRFISKGIVESQRDALACTESRGGVVDGIWD